MAMSSPTAALHSPRFTFPVDVCTVPKLVNRNGQGARSYTVAERRGQRRRTVHSVQVQVQRSAAQCTCAIGEPSALSKWNLSAILSQISMTHTPIRRSSPTIFRVGRALKRKTNSSQQACKYRSIGSYAALSVADAQRGSTCEKTYKCMHHVVSLHR
jgi:hypothetical protein